MVAQTRRLKAPMGYYGGKQQLAPLIVSLLPPHETYVEVFGGAASVLFAKPPSRLEVYNDLDSGVVTFFRVLRDPKRAKRLRELLELTPYAREEWAECKASWRIASDEVEMARRWFTAICLSYSANIGTPSWGYVIQPAGHPVRKFRNRIAGLAQFTERLQQVQIEHDDFEAILRRYDAPGVLFYLDPPYLPETRTDGGARMSGGYRYEREMTRADHERLLSLVSQLHGMAIISGYGSDLYSAALDGWTCVTKTQETRSSNYHSRPKRTECLWISPNATQRQLSLFD